MPVLSVLPTAYWVGGQSTDSTGLKQTSKAEWKNVNLVVDEIAVLVPIPDAYMQDSQFPVWEETRPLIVEAIGSAIDAAALFGVNKPTVWPNPIYQSSVAASNASLSTAGEDFAQVVAYAARDLKKNDGYRTTGFAAEPGLGWELVGLRSADGVPIYTQNLQGPIPTGLYGFPIKEVENGAWDSDEAKLILGDWSKSIVGIRQDISFTKHDSGVISDDDGVVVFNAMQQDSTIWRAVMRLAWATANPANRIATDQTAVGNSRYPFWTIVNATTYDYS
jgi:HK97 family phage major capsid protein